MYGQSLVFCVSTFIWCMSVMQLLYVWCMTRFSVWYPFVVYLVCVLTLFDVCMSGIWPPYCLSVTTFTRPDNNLGDLVMLHKDRL